MRGMSLTIWLIVFAVMTFCVWASIAWLVEIVRAEGQVVSSSRPQIIQNIEGGILAELTVDEGDVVEQGQTLARLSSTQYQAAVDELSDQIATLAARKLRLDAELAGQARFDVPYEIERRVAGVVASERALLAARLSENAAQVSGARAVLEQAAKERDLLERMYDQGIAPLIEVTRARKLESDAEAQLALVQTMAELDRANTASETQGQLAALRPRLKQAQDQLSRTVLVAPMRGVVNKLSLTTIGGVVRPGEEIMQIMPLNEELFIEARVKPRDIAQIRLGQEATVKLSAYDYTIYGSLQATVKFVSADTFRDERARTPDGDPYYKVTLSVDLSNLTQHQRTFEIRPGMQATVELQTGGKTILTYLTKPLYKVSEAMRER
jgi:membrane fusion protein, adhesin transport system